MPYVRRAIPGSTTPPSWLDGSNCQRFAYGVLSLAGLTLPPLRSSELWEDAVCSQVMTGAPAPLDLVLFNATTDPWGAHVGVWLGPDAVLHLCREIGRPVIWPLASFAARSRYVTVLGAKRVRRDALVSG